MVRTWEEGNQLNGLNIRENSVPNSFCRAHLNRFISDVVWIPLSAN